MSIVFDRLSDDYKVIYYRNVSDKVLSVIIKVYECFTDTIIFSNELELDAGIQYYTYMPQAWKNRKLIIYDKITNEILLPIWVDGEFTINDVDGYGYIKKLFTIETDPHLQMSIHATLSEHFMDKKYENYVDVEEGDTVIDIGFNYGVFALKSLHNKASKIYGFEPNTHVYNLCKQIYTDREKVEIFKFAVGGKNEKVNFNQGKGSLTSSTYGLVEDFETSYVVDSISLVDFLFFHNIKKIDFLKIDCEGSEYEIFESIPDDLFSTIKKIHVEFHYNDGVKVESLIKKLERNNFEWKYDYDSNQQSVIGMIYAKKRNIIPTSNKKELIDDFYWVVHFSEKYEKFIPYLMDSLTRYSSRKCVFYTINYSPDFTLKKQFESEQFIFKRIEIPEGKKDDLGRSVEIMNSKPLILMDVINSFPDKKFVHIDSDIFLTVNADDISKYFNRLKNFPLFNSHIHDVVYLSNIKPDEEWTDCLGILLDDMGVNDYRVQPRRKCNIIVFDENSYWFFKKQMEVYNEYKESDIPGILAIFDEDSANALASKFKLDECLPLVDIEDSYETNVNKFNDLNHPFHATHISPHVVLPKNENDIFFFHNFKKEEDYVKLVNHYTKFVLDINDFVVTYTNNLIIFEKVTLLEDKVIENIVDFVLQDITGREIYRLDNQNIFNYKSFYIDNIHLDRGFYNIKMFETHSKKQILNKLIKI
jgi:FkbM family methyltransferase